MMLKLSYISFLIFSVVNFFSPTLKSIFNIAGIILWVLSLRKPYKNAFNPKLNTMNIIALVLIFMNLLQGFIYGKTLLFYINVILGDYTLWICLTSLFYCLEKENKTYKINIFNKESNFSYKEIFSVCIISSSLVTGFYIILQFFKIIPSYNSGIFGILDQPFTSSGLVLISIFISFILKDFFTENFSEKKILISQIFYSIILFQVLIIVILGQITVWASLLLGLFFYFIFTRQINLKKVLSGILVIVFVIFVAQISSPRIERKLKWFSSFEKLTTNKSISCRYEIWKQNLEALKERPVFGLEKVINYNCKTKGTDNFLTHMHNIYLQKLIENGFVGFLVWLSFYILLFINLLKFPNKINLALMSLMIGLSFEGLLENWWGDSEVLQLTLLTLAMFSNVKIKP